MQNVINDLQSMTYWILTNKLNSKAKVTQHFNPLKYTMHHLISSKTVVIYCLSYQIIVSFISLFYVQVIRCNRMVANSVLLTFHVNSTPIWRFGNLASRESSIEYNLDLYGGMRLNSVPHLPRFVVMDAKFFIRKVSKFIFYLF